MEEDKEQIILKRKSKKRYINNNDFHLALVDYYDKSLENPNIPISNYIGECIMKIAEKLSSKHFFYGYNFREDMVGDGLLKMSEAVILKKYDVLITNNPFAYFTQICWNCFWQRVAKEKKELYIKHANFDKQNIFEEIRKEIEFDDEAHRTIINNFENPEKHKVVHRNLSYESNRKKKGRKIKIDNETNVLT